MSLAFSSLLGPGASTNKMFVDFVTALEMEPPRRSMSIWILLRDVGKVPVMQTFMLESLVGCDDDDDDDDDDDEDDDVCPTGRICTRCPRFFDLVALFAAPKLAMLFATISPTPSTASREIPVVVIVTLVHTAPDFVISQSRLFELL